MTNSSDLRRTCTWMGKDLVILIEGGVSHIGAMACAQPFQNQGKPQASLSSFCRLGHREDGIAQAYAKTACEVTGGCVTAIAGIHYDEFNQERLREVMSWVEKDIQQMKRELQSEKEQKETDC